MRKMKFEIKRIGGQKTQFSNSDYISGIYDDWLLRSWVISLNFGNLSICVIWQFPQNWNTQFYKKKEK